MFILRDPSQRPKPKLSSGTKVRCLTLLLIVEEIVVVRVPSLHMLFAGDELYSTIYIKLCDQALDYLRFFIINIRVTERS